jgi:hypothetical protein
LDFKRVTENDKVSAVIGGSRFRQTSSHQGTSQTVDTLVLGGSRLYLSQGTGDSLEAVW